MPSRAMASILSRGTSIRPISPRARAVFAAGADASTLTLAAPAFMRELLLAVDAVRGAVERRSSSCDRATCSRAADICAVANQPTDTRPTVNRTISTNRSASTVGRGLFAIALFTVAPDIGRARSRVQLAAVGRVHLDVDAA